MSQLSSLYDPAADGDLPGLVSVQAVHSASEHGRLHAAFARLEIAEIDERIGQLRRALEDNQSNLHKLSRSKAGACDPGRRLRGRHGCKRRDRGTKGVSRV